MEDSSMARSRKLLLLAVVLGGVGLAAPAQAQASTGEGQHLKAGKAAAFQGGVGRSGSRPPGRPPGRPPVTPSS
jgi:hypothetical protein